MSLFLSDTERAFIKSTHTHGVTARLYWTTLNRVMRRAESPGLMSSSDTAMWWHAVEEVICDAAMMQALNPSPQLGGWLRDSVVSIVRRSEGDWIGPPFRGRPSPPVAELETGHVMRAVAVALDLVPDVFTDAERDEATEVLRARAIPMVLRHLRGRRALHNHRCVVNAGLAVAGAVLNDAEAMEAAASEFTMYLSAYQPDGSYGETLQYSNYATWSMMLVYESLVRRDASFAKRLDMTPYAGFARWAAYSLMYRKPLAGFGQAIRPRSVNFGDSTAIFSPSAELLLHIASRARDARPADAAIARWLYDTCDSLAPAAPPHDQATFGFVPRPGFLTMPLLAHATVGKSPSELQLPTLASFSGGDAIARDAWNGRTLLAVRSENDPKHTANHLHGDLNSCILVHNNERLLIDPGHSCYRGQLHEMEVRSGTHNTCTFHDPSDNRTLEQSRPQSRRINDDDTPGPPVNRGVKQLLATTDAPVTVISSDAAALYGAPLERFVRTWILCGTHVVFAIDQIRSARPLITRWNWLLNNRDGLLDMKTVHPDRLIVRRADAGMKLIHLGGAQLGGPTYAFVHDCYHPLPGQIGEGRQGSGWLMNWHEVSARTERTVVHAIMLDDAGRIAGWHLKQADGETILQGPGGGIDWRLRVNETTGEFTVTDAVRGDCWRIHQDASGMKHLERQIKSKPDERQP